MEFFRIKWHIERDEDEERIEAREERNNWSFEVEKQKDESLVSSLSSLKQRLFFVLTEIEKEREKLLAHRLLLLWLEVTMISFVIINE